VSSAFGRYFEVHRARVLAHHHQRRDWGLNAAELSRIASKIEEASGVELDDPSDISSSRPSASSCNGCVGASPERALNRGP
jgi:hypothetical protein